MSNFNKDFYSYLPIYLREDLDKKIDKYQNRHWFEEAWESYRSHVKSIDKKHMQTPNLFFQQYINIDNVEKEDKGVNSEDVYEYMIDNGIESLDNETLQEENAKILKKVFDNKPEYLQNMESEYIDETEEEAPVYIEGENEEESELKESTDENEETMGEDKELL